MRAIAGFFKGAGFTLAVIVLFGFLFGPGLWIEKYYGEFYGTAFILAEFVILIGLLWGVVEYYEK